jgi:CubicO group peptidase (beta-lactamase class C family)
VPGIAACIIKNDSVFWEGYYGYANIALNISVTDSTIFNLASISKTIMVTALMQLYEKGYFQLEDSINTYLPFPVRTPAHPEVPVTFKMLLTHTSSIRDNWNVLDQVYGPGDPTMPLGTFLSNYLTPGGQYYSASLNFYSQVPGTYWSYCNEGAALAGYLVEVLTGIPFDEYCRDSIFIPLNMQHTAWFLRDLDTALVARPYGYSGGTYHDYGLNGYPDYPDGLLRTTLHSLAKFLLMNMKGGESNGIRLLDTSTVRLIRTVHIPIIPAPWNLYKWGLIWMKPLWSDYDIWGHTGGDYGVTTAMFLRESDDTGVILLTNADGDQPYKAAVDRLFDEITVGVEEELVDIPKDFILMQNYPNPFNSTSVIKYSVPKLSQVSLKIFNTLGQEIETLVNEEKPVGTYELNWNADNLPSGVYFYRLQAGDYVQTRKMILLK